MIKVVEVTHRRPGLEVEEFAQAKRDEPNFIDPDPEVILTTEHVVVGDDGG